MKRSSANLRLRFHRKPFIERKRKRILTTCISAICEHGLLVGCADRMITSNQGEVEFELKTTSTGNNLILKITPLTDSKNIVLMMAGDTSVQSEISMEMTRLMEKAEKESKKTWTVNDAVQLYIDLYNDKKSRIAESAILAPLGLNRKEFISNQKLFSDEFSKYITERMAAVQFGVETIIAGNDYSGAHHYKLQENPDLGCIIASSCDALGFAAIGIGARHAEAQFMLNGYSRLVPQEEALWLVYMAKRKSEIAAGVGKITDLFSIGSKNKRFSVLNWLEPRLAELYAAFETQQSAAFDEAQNSLKSHLQGLKFDTS
jgi:hypothetical protein